MSTNNSGIYLQADKQNVTVNNSGVYQINFNSVGSGQNNHEYVLTVAVDGVCQQSMSVKHKLAAGGDHTIMAGSGICYIAGGSNVTLKVKDTSGNGAGVYYHSNLNMHRIAVK